MTRFAATLLIIYSLMIATISTPVHAQPQTRPNETSTAEFPSNELNDLPANTVARPLKKKVDLQKVFDEETKKFSSDTANFDPLKIERNKAKQAKKQKWSHKNTIFIVVFAAAIAVLVWFVLKYGKECIQTNYPDCTPTVDEGCYCERYAVDDNSNRGVSRR